VLTYRITRVPNGAYVPYHTRTQRTLREIKIACAPRRAARGRPGRAGHRFTSPCVRAPRPCAARAASRGPAAALAVHALGGGRGAGSHVTVRPCPSTVRCSRPPCCCPSACAASRGPAAAPAAAPPPALLRAAPLLPLLQSKSLPPRVLRVAHLAPVGVLVTVAHLLDLFAPPRRLRLKTLALVVDVAIVWGTRH
jgi:hypothetical protein